jgi:tol-pal system protein YbgF
MSKNGALLVVAAVVCSTAVLPAQNRQDLQIQADLRLLAEQVSKLQIAVNQLGAEIKTVNGRVDQVADANVKTAANQQVSTTNITTAIGTLRENMQDNTVRVSQLAQEFGAVRSGLRMLTDQLNSLVNLLQPAAVAPADPTAAAPGGAVPPATAAAGPLQPVTVAPSPATVFRAAQNDYASARYDLAIEGFREYLEKFPDGAEAASAQLQIGESFYQKKMCQQAIPEYQKVVDSHRSSDLVPDALLMLGVCNLDLNRRTNATTFFERVIKQYPDSSSALLARQRLDALRR